MYTRSGVYFVSYITRTGPGRDDLINGPKVIILRLSLGHRHAHLTLFLFPLRLVPRPKDSSSSSTGNSFAGVLRAPDHWNPL